MTYDRAFTLLIDAGLDYPRAEALARDVASVDRSTLRHRLEAAQRDHAATRGIRKLYVQATCEELRQ